MILWHCRENQKIVEEYQGNISLRQEEKKCSYIFCFDMRIAVYIIFHFCDKVHLTYAD